jgi:folate-binding protein YgfZ
MFGPNDTDSDLLPFFIELGGNTELRDNSQVIKNYSNPEEESYSLHNGIGLRYLNTSGIIELKGNDSIDFLHRISTNSITNLNKEDVRKTIFTSEKGRIIGVSTILNFESYLLLVSSANNQPKVMSWINKYVIADDVKISDASHRFNIFEILGPQSQSFLTFAFGESIGDVPENSFRVISSEGVLFFLAKIKNHNNTIKHWILADQVNGKKLVQYMIENKGPYDFNLIGEDAYNAYRIEMGIPSDPNELNDFYNPLESGINYLIDFNKGCYIGQEVIARLDTYDKVQKNLMGICFSGDIDLLEKYSLLDDQKNEIGTVTSTAYSPRIKKNIGMGYVKKENAQNGNKAIAKNGVKEIEVTLLELPFKK